MPNNSNFPHARPPYEVDNFPDLEESTYPLSVGKDCKFAEEFEGGFNLVESEPEESCLTFKDVFKKIRVTGTCIADSAVVGNDEVFRYLQTYSVKDGNLLGTLSLDEVDIIPFLTNGTNTISSASNSKEYGEIFSHAPQGTTLNLYLSLDSGENLLCEGMFLEWYEDVGGDSYDEFPIEVTMNGNVVNSSDLRRAILRLSQNPNTLSIVLEIGITVRTQYYNAEGDKVTFDVYTKG